MPYPVKEEVVKEVKIPVKEPFPVRIPYPIPYPVVHDHHDGKKEGTTTTPPPKQFPPMIYQPLPPSPPQPTIIHNYLPPQDDDHFRPTRTRHKIHKKRFGQRKGIQHFDDLDEHDMMSMEGPIEDTGVDYHRPIPFKPFPRGGYLPPPIVASTTQLQQHVPFTTQTLFPFDPRCLIQGVGAVGQSQPFLPQIPPFPDSAHRVVVTPPASIAGAFPNLFATHEGGFIGQHGQQLPLPHSQVLQLPPLQQQQQLHPPPGKDCLKFCH